MDRGARGLYTQWNPVDAPNGALAVAKNVVIDREGIIEKRRGFRRYGSTLSGAAELFEYKDRLLVRQSNGTLSYDSDGAGTWTAYSGTFDGPDSRRMRSVEARRTLYLTTDEGIKSTDTLTVAPTQSGVERGLDLQGTVTGAGASWLTLETQVAYRVVFIREDANKRELIGAPSPRELVTNGKVAVTWTRSGATVTITQTGHGYSNSDTVEILDSSDTAALPNQSYTISNVMTNTYDVTGIAAGATSGTASAGKDADVSLNFTLPDDLVAGNFYELYRTTLSADVSTDPGDTMRKITRQELASGDITAGTVTYVDTFDPSFLEDPLYTNSEEEGAAQANFRPPFARDIARWKGHVWYTYTRLRHRRVVQLISTAGLTATTDTVTIDDGTTSETYTFHTAEDVPSKNFILNTTAVTEAQKIEKTMKSFCRIVNRASTAYYAQYVSTVDDAPGKVEIFRRNWADTPFDVRANSAGTGDNFEPVLPTSGSDVQSNADEKKNRVIYAKFEQPDAVPIVNIFDIGSEDDEIERVIALKDVLVFMKTDDGVHIITGETERDFTLKEVAPSARVNARESPVELDSSVWFSTTQGILRIPQSGEPEIVSRPVEVDLVSLFGLTVYPTLSHSAAYESQRKYIFSSPQVSGDTSATLSWVYNHVLRTWVHWDKPIADARVLSTDDKLYIIQPVDGFVLQERKSFGTNLADFQDEDIPVTIDTLSTTVNADGKTVTVATITYTYTGHTITDGLGSLEQGSTVGRIASIAQVGATTQYTLTMKEEYTAFTTGAATYGLPIMSEVRWVDDSDGNPAVNKQFIECQIYFEANNTTKNQMAFRTDESPSEEFVSDLDLPRASGWGISPWGNFPWGSSSGKRSIPMRSFIPTAKKRGRAIGVTFRHRVARESFAITQMSVYYRRTSRRTTVAPR